MMLQASSLQRATFAGGCFWGPELLFQRVPGVVATEVGYSQGSLESPTYEDVCSGDSGHTEVVQVRSTCPASWSCIPAWLMNQLLLVQVTYDPSVVSYEQLLGTFWAHIDPTLKNGQGHDRGSQYRTGIYTHTPEQAQAAEQSRQKLQASMQVCLHHGARSRDVIPRLWGNIHRGLLQVPIATEVEELRMYHTAEDYHQQYLSKGGRFGTAQDPSKGCAEPIRCYG